MPKPLPQWRLLIHGGAGQMARGSLSADADTAARRGLDAALCAGESILQSGGAALDAVAAAVCVLEDDPVFNAGRGAALTFDAMAELDAAIMDGATRDAGAVSSVKYTRNPVLLARAVMDHSPHVFVSRAGADAFSLEMALDQVDNEYFITPARRAQVVAMLAEPGGPGAYYDVDLKYGTVGAVAVDVHGHCAAATSTGGLTGKRWGRIGDSPVIGAGTFADDRACAVSATGAGEFFLRVGVAHEISARMRMLGESAQAAADAVLAEVKALGGSGGVIVAAPHGGQSETRDWAFAFNTPGMYRAMSAGGVNLPATSRMIAIYGDED